jgi:hypothetical protein
LTAEQIAVLDSTTTDPAKQIELIEKLFPKSNGGGNGDDSRPQGKNSITDAQLEAMSPYERALYYQNLDAKK